MIEIDKMPAGEEMNKLIATEVMGWRWDYDWYCLVPPEQVAKPSEMWTEWKEGIDEDGEEYWYREPVKGTMVSGVAYNGDASKVVLPDFSGDIGDAWKVVEKVHMEGYLLYPLQAEHKAITGPWTARFIWDDDPAGLPWEAGFYGAGETVPLAICRAAYKVMVRK